MLKLCGFRVSNYHNKVLIALLEKCIAFEEDANVHPSQKDEYLAQSPMGKVPYLQVNGAILRESGVICEYLEDAYPQKPDVPDHDAGIEQSVRFTKRRHVEGLVVKFVGRVANGESRLATVRLLRYFMDQGPHGIQGWRHMASHSIG